MASLVTAAAVVVVELFHSHLDRTDAPSAILVLVRILHHVALCFCSLLMLYLFCVFCVRRGKRPAKMPLRRRNSWNSVELCLAIDDLDVQVLYDAVQTECTMPKQADT